MDNQLKLIFIPDNMMIYIYICDISAIVAKKTGLIEIKNQVQLREDNSKRIRILSHERVSHGS